jgi:hypothetical protein
MKGYRFYEEFRDKCRQESMDTVVALLLDEYQQPYMYYSESAGEWVADVVSGVFDTPNSEVGLDSVALGYLHERCKRVSEATARQIHPRLFTYLDQEVVIEMPRMW